MKNLLLLLSFFSLVISSCSKSSNNLNTIPHNASSVTSINLTSLVRKLDFKSMKELKSVRALNKEIAEENKKASRIMDDLMENPLSSGVDFLSDVFVYTINDAQDENFMCISIAIQNKEKFENFAKKIIRETDEEYDLISEEKFQYFLMEQMAISYDDDKAVMLLPLNRKSRTNLDYEAERLMELSETKQLSNDSNFKSFLNDKKDISFWISSNAFKNEREFREAEKEFGFDLSDNFLASHISFNDGEILANAKLNLNEDLEKEMSKNMMGSGLNQELLNNFPKEYLALYAVSIDIEEMYATFENEEEFKNLESKFEEITNASLQEFIQNLNGNLLFSFYGMDEISVDSYYGKRNQPIPLMGAVIDFKNKEILYDLINKVPREMITDYDDYFEIEIPNSSAIYLAIKEHQLYVSNDYDGLLDNALSENPENTLNQLAIAKNIKNEASFASLNLDLANYPDNIQDMIYKNMNRNEKKIARIFENTAKEINFSMTDNTSMNVSLELTDKDENSLNTLIKFVDDNYQSFNSL